MKHKILVLILFEIFILKNNLSAQKKNYRKPIQLVQNPCTDSTLDRDVLNYILAINKMKLCEYNNEYVPLSIELFYKNNFGINEVKIYSYYSLSYQKTSKPLIFDLVFKVKNTVNNVVEIESINCPEQFNGNDFCKLSKYFNQFNFPDSTKLDCIGTLEMNYWRRNDLK